MQLNFTLFICKFLFIHLTMNKLHCDYKVKFSPTKISQIERGLLLIITLQYDQERGMYSRLAGDEWLLHSYQQRRAKTQVTRILLPCTMVTQRIKGRCLAKSLPLHLELFLLINMALSQVAISLHLMNGNVMKLRKNNLHAHRLTRMATSKIHQGRFLTHLVQITFLNPLTFYNIMKQAQLKYLTPILHINKFL